MMHVEQLDHELRTGKLGTLSQAVKPALLIAEQSYPTDHTWAKERFQRWSLYIVIRSCGKSKFFSIFINAGKAVKFYGHTVERERERERAESKTSERKEGADLTFLSFCPGCGPCPRE